MHLQFLTTILTERGIIIMSFSSASRAGFMPFFFRSVHHCNFCSDYAGRYRDNTVTDQHDQAGNKFTRRVLPGLYLHNLLS